MLTVLIIYIALMVLWFLGVGAAIFHVLKYRFPQDKLIFALWIFLAVCAIGFLFSVFAVFGLNWEGF